jgi:hypothetical protein
MQYITEIPTAFLWVIDNLENYCQGAMSCTYDFMTDVTDNDTNLEAE